MDKYANLLGVKDIARLVGYEPQSISTLIARSRVRGIPFPQPKVIISGCPAFDVREVSKWWKATGRGELRSRWRLH